MKLKENKFDFNDLIIIDEKVYGIPISGIIIGINRLPDYVNYNIYEKLDKGYQVIQNIPEENINLKRELKLIKSERIVTEDDYNKYKMILDGDKIFYIENNMINEKLTIIDFYLIDKYDNLNTDDHILTNDNVVSIVNSDELIRHKKEDSYKIVKSSDLNIKVEKFNPTEISDIISHYNKYTKLPKYN
jgi:hypothetical protein